MSALTCERLRQLLHYDFETGIFTWRLSRYSGNRRKPFVVEGQLAGYVHQGHTGYLVIGIDGVQYGAHRLVWLYVFGEWPINLIDHRDENKTNNRLVNLRDVSAKTNAEHITKSRGKLGLLGVRQKGQRFYASIVTDSRQISLGAFSSKDQAHTAYVNAKRILHRGGTL